MWTTGSDFFVEFPGATNQKTLHPGSVAGMQEGSVLFKPSGSLAMEPGQDLRIYFERDREFMQQPATVEALLDDDDMIVAIGPLGEAVSAESRQFYRVSTVFADLSIKIGDERCPLTDISSLGFSILSRRHRSEGEMLIARFEHNGVVFEGKAQVQSVTNLGNTHRYGMLCASDKSHGATLQNGLQQVSMTVQRAQLRRRARA